MPAQSKLKKDCLSGVIWVLAFAAILLLSRSLNERIRTYPTIITAVGLVFSVLFLCMSLVKLNRSKKAAAEETEAQAAEKADRKIFIKRKVLPWVLLIAFILCFRYIGFTISCFLFVLCFSHIMSTEPNWKVEILVALGFTAVMYLTFVVFLGIKLPALGVLWVL